MTVHVAAVRTLEQAAELVDELGRRMLAGETVVAICDEVAADVIEFHGEIYASAPAH